MNSLPPSIMSIAPSRLKYALLLLCALGLVAYGIFLIFEGKPSNLWLGWMWVAFFGAGVLFFAKQLLDDRPRVVLDEIGVFDRTLGLERIPWSEIAGAYVRSAQGSAFVCLELRDADRWTRKLSRTRQALVATNVKLGFQPLNINLSGTAVDPGLVLDVVLKKSAEHRSGAS